MTTKKDGAYENTVALWKTLLDVALTKRGKDLLLDVRDHNGKSEFVVCNGTVCYDDQHIVATTYGGPYDTTRRLGWYAIESICVHVDAKYTGIDVRLTNTKE